MELRVGNETTEINEDPESLSDTTCEEPMDHKFVGG